YSAADRKVQFDAVMKAHGLFGEMTKLAERIDGARDAVRDRLKGLPDGDALTRKLRELGDKLEAARKQIVATTEGGAITGEERIREHLDQLYGALDRWEGRPAKYKLDRIDVLRRELAEVEKTVEGLITKDARALDDELKQHKLQPLPQLSALDRGEERDGRTLLINRLEPLDRVRAHQVAPTARQGRQIEARRQRRADQHEHRGGDGRTRRHPGRLERLA